ncbi:Transcriptional regulatory protein BtsR [compost metagenome]
MIESLKPDVVLLDIRMPGLDGLQVAAKLCERETPPAIVFCAAQDEFAVDAFKVSTVGFLVKPVRPENLLEALKKAERPNRVQLAALTRPAAESGNGPRSHISARTRKGIELIPLDQVVYFIADHKYVTLRHEGGEVLLDEPLKALEDEFGERFVRIHRNALVARDRIERLQRTPLGHFQLYLKGLNGDALIVSRRHVAGVRKMMQQL